MLHLLTLCFLIRAKVAKMSVIPYRYLYCIKRTDADEDCEYGDKIGLSDIANTFASVPAEYEVKLMFSGFDTAATAASVKFEDLLSRSFTIQPKNPAIPQYIALTVNNGESCVGKKQMFWNVMISFIGTGTTEIKFGSLTCKNAYSGGASSVTNFIIEKATFDVRSLDDWSKKITTSMKYKVLNEFIVQDDYLLSITMYPNNIGITSSDGKKSYLTMILPDKIPDSKTILIKLMDQDKDHPVNLLCDKKSTLSFGLDLTESKQDNLYSIVTGDMWNTQNIKINLGNKNFQMESKDVGKGVSTPKITATGTGKIMIDGKEFQYNFNDSPTTKGGLGGGEIAGIVIACIVVVAAIAVCLYFFVFKKNPKKEVSN